MGTDRRKFTVFLPPALAVMCGEPTIDIYEERDGISAEEVTLWRAFYELRAKESKKK